MQPHQSTQLLNNLVAKLNASFTDIHVKRLLMGSIDLANKATFGNVYTMCIDATGTIRVYVQKDPIFKEPGTRLGHYLRQA